MKLEDQVVNLESSKKLKALGAEQKSLYFWAVEMNEGRETNKWSLCQGEHLLPDHPKYSAFTVSELGGMLPAEIVHARKTNDIELVFELILFKRHENISGFYCDYRESSGGSISDFIHGSLHSVAEGRTEAEARGKMLIYLLENKLIKI